MLLDDRSFGHSLDALKELLHSLRTPLGVALTIAKDSKNKLPLGEKDHEDAVQALEKIRSFFDELRPILNLGEIKSAPIEVEELSAICEIEGYKFVVSNKLNGSFLADVSLLKIWFQSFFSQSDKIIHCDATDGSALLSIKSEEKDVKQVSMILLKLLTSAFSSLGGKLEILPNESRLTLPTSN